MKMDNIARETSPNCKHFSTDEIPRQAVGLIKRSPSIQDNLRGGAIKKAPTIMYLIDAS